MTLNVITFCPQEAALYGVEEAILIQNFRFWIAKNTANKRNRRAGRTWTYNSLDAFCELFPFWSKAQVRRILDSLILQGIIVTGNYNDKRNDRTLWYAFASEDKFLQNPQKSSCADSSISVDEKKTADSCDSTMAKPAETLICGNQHMDMPDSAHPYAEISTPLPDSNQLIPEGETRADARDAPAENLEKAKEPARIYDQKRIEDLVARKNRREFLEPEDFEYLMWANRQPKPAKSAAAPQIKTSAVVKTKPQPAPLPPCEASQQEQDIWVNKILAALRMKHGEGSYNSWLRPIYLHRIEVRADEGHVVQYLVPTRFMRDWVLAHYAEDILALWRREDGRIISINITVRMP